HYRFYLAFDSLFTTGLDSQYTGTNELLWDDLSDDQTYWWRVKAFDTHGNGTFSNQKRHFFTYVCELPSLFALLQPTDSSQLPFEETSFCWQAVSDPDPGDAVTYTLYLASNDTSFTFDMDSDTCLTIDADTLVFTEGAVVEWWVEAHTGCPDTTMECVSRFHFYPPSAVSGKDALLPTEFALHQNWPNPFNPTTAIRYDVKQTCPVWMKVFDILGREVATLVQGTVQAGSYTITWNALQLPSGVYLCRMQAQDFVQTRKLVLVK
ncbi:T9SS type A sorting domain-containing protein, partial [bacterium]|nr:T9SS type A sorting domain-containing protein [bacterium]